MLCPETVCWNIFLGGNGTRKEHKWITNERPFVKLCCSSVLCFFCVVRTQTPPQTSGGKVEHEVWKGYFKERKGFTNTRVTKELLQSGKKRSRARTIMDDLTGSEALKSSFSEAFKQPSSLLFYWHFVETRFILLWWVHLALGLENSMECSEMA